MKKIKFYKFLKITLLIFSFGFYCLPVDAFENPAHPKTPDEIAEEQRKENNSFKPNQYPPEDKRSKHKENQTKKI